MVVVSDTHLLYKQWLCKCYRVYEGYIEFHTMQKGSEKQTSFPKESIENGDFYKPVLNKIRWPHTNNARNTIS